MGVASSFLKRNTYSAIPKGVYALKRDFNASTRLTAQHYLWKDVLDFNIHPRIPVDGNIRIADVATGNAIWLLDVARDIDPAAKLDGFDVSLDQCPPSQWLPSNLNLHTWNIFEEPPAEYKGVFDVVHIRLITVAIKNNDPRPVLVNLRKLLKPGGYLQWDEVDSVDWNIKTVASTIHTEKVQRLFQQLCGSDESTPFANAISWKRNMVDTLETNGFHKSTLYKTEYDETMARYWSDVYMSTWEEFAKQVIKNPTASALLGEEAMDQVRAGSAINCPKLVWVAQKA